MVANFMIVDLKPFLVNEKYTGPIGLVQAADPDSTFKLSIVENPFVSIRLDFYKIKNTFFNDDNLDFG